MEQHIQQLRCLCRWYRRAQNTVSAVWRWVRTLKKRNSPRAPGTRAWWEIDEMVKHNSQGRAFTSRDRYATNLKPPLDFFDGPKTKRLMPSHQHRESRMAIENSTNLFSKLPVEIMQQVLESLSYQDILRLTETSWPMRLYLLSVTKKQRYEVLSEIEQTYARYVFHYACSSCERLLRIDNYAPWMLQYLPKCPNQIIDEKRKCTECLLADGDIDAMIVSGALWNDIQAYLFKRCVICKRAKILFMHEWCEDCSTCLDCCRDWALDFDGFCTACRGWRQDAMDFYTRWDIYPTVTASTNSLQWYPALTSRYTLREVQALVRHCQRMVEKRRAERLLS